MSRFSFLLKYAEPGKHYDREREMNDLIEHGDIWDIKDVVDAVQLPREELDKIWFEHHHAFNMAHRMLRQHNISPKIIHHMVYHIDPEVRSAVAESKYLTPMHIDHMINDPDPTVRSSLAMNPNLKVTHIDKLIHDVSPTVRLGALQHPLSTDKHAKQLENDPDKRISNLSKILLTK